MFEFQIFVLLVAVILGCGAEDCSQYGKSWMTLEDQCYLVYSSMPSTTDWYDAEKYCQQNGGHLLSLLSQQEAESVHTMLRSNWYGSVALWIGMNWAAQQPNEFVWSDGSKIEFSKLDTSPLDPLDQNMCVLLDSYTGTWIKTHCSGKLNFMCKRPVNREVTPVTPKPTPAACKPGWIHYKSKLDGTSKCFQFFGYENSQNLNWTNALENCAKNLGPRHNLISIHSEEEQTFITSKMPETNVSFWIGLNRINFVDFGWSNNKKVNYYSWAPSEPTGVWQRCVEMQNNKYRGGQWADTSCAAKQGFICEWYPDVNVPADPTIPPIPCPPGYAHYASSCFKIQASTGGANLTWSEAEKECQMDGGHLASINNPREQAFIYNSVIGSPSKTNFSFWIGLNDNAHQGILEWTDNWPAYYADWAKNEPKLSANPRCVFIDTKTKFWNTSDCGKRHGYICKITKEDPPEVPEKNTRICPGHLGLPWIDVGLEHCYFIRIGSGSWGNAYLNCSFYGSQLASFHSQHEVDILSGYIKQANLNLWIGLQKRFQGDYRWKDGSILDYENWGEIRIENIYEKEKIKNGMCVQIQSSDMTWMPNDCTGSSGHICKIEKGALESYFH